MSKQYLVPLVAQTSSDTCWHASALMIWDYWQEASGREGPMNTLARTWKRNKSILPDQFSKLAETVGMNKLPKHTIPFTAHYLSHLLTKHGPLWCAGHWFGPGHIIVLTGVSHNHVYINDPDGGVRKIQTIAWFNQKLDSMVDGCLMRKDPFRY